MGPVGGQIDTFRTAGVESAVTEDAAAGLRADGGAVPGRSRAGVAAPKTVGGRAERCLATVGILAEERGGRPRRAVAPFRRARMEAFTGGTGRGDPGLARSTGARMSATATVGHAPADIRFTAIPGVAVAIAERSEARIRAHPAGAARSHVLPHSGQDGAIRAARSAVKRARLGIDTRPLRWVAATLRPPTTGAAGRTADAGTRTAVGDQVVARLGAALPAVGTVGARGTAVRAAVDASLGADGHSGVTAVSRRERAGQMSPVAAGDCEGEEVLGGARSVGGAHKECCRL